MKSLSLDKKGVGRGVIAAIIFLFVMSFLTILGYLLLNSFITEFSSTAYYSSEVQYVGETFLNSLRTLDYVIPLIMIIFIIGIAVTSYKVASAPVFFLITFVMAAMYGFISYFFVYIFSQIVSQPIFTATILYFPNTILICTNLHWVSLIMLLVGSIALYGKKEKGQFVE